MEKGKPTMCKCSSCLLLQIVLTAIAAILSVITQVSAADSYKKIPWTRKALRAVRVVEPPKIDGRLDDSCWKLAEPSSGFVELQPYDGKLAVEQTIVMALYDHKNLYLGLHCLDSQPDEIPRRLIPRDANPWPEDCITISLDTFHDRRSCYVFGVNTMGCQRDMTTDRSHGWFGNWGWDGVWKSAAQVVEDGWECEVAIPFKILRFSRAKEQIWGINIQRLQKRLMEDTAWDPVTSDDADGILDMSKAGDLVGIIDPQRGYHIDLIPHIVLQNEKEIWKGETGIDIKYNPSSHLSFNATLNPDFAQVEADKQRINLSRFPLYFDERRPFFVQGKDLFGAMNVFYSRRIQSPDWGLKLIGTSGPNKYGYLSAMDRTADGENPLFNVLRLQRDVLNKSTVGIVGVSKSSGAEGNSGALASDVRLRPGEHDEMDLDLIKTWNPHQNRDSWRARVAYTHRADPWGFYGRYTGMGKEFNVDQFGFINHDAGIGSHETSCYLEYRWHIRSHGIDQLEFWHGGSASKRSDDKNWGWSWDNIDIQLALINQAWVAFSHETWLARYQGKGFRGQNYNLNINLPPAWRFTGRIRCLYADQIDWSDPGLYLGKVKKFRTNFTLQATNSLAFDAYFDVARKYFRKTRTDKIGWLRITYTPTRHFLLRSFIQADAQTRVLQTNFLLAYQYDPLSWIYLAYNNSLDTSDKWGSPGQWCSTDHIAIIKVTKLLSR